MHRRLLALLLSIAAVGCAHPSRPAGSAPAWSAAVPRLLGQLCSSDIALLGEGAGHGDARALAFKAALVQHLVERCGFDAVIFEASSYDFLEIDRRLRRGQPVTRAMLSSAIGGLWNGYEEMQPLITWMHEALRAGRLRLGGMDDQLGSAGAFYSISEMPGEMSELLPNPQNRTCRLSFRQFIYGQLGSSEVERAPLLTCLLQVRAALEASPQSEDRMAQLQNVANFERAVARQGTTTERYIEGRDLSMWRNHQWWVAHRFAAGAKVIVWGATAHLSRDATLYPPFATVRNFGSRLSEEYGRSAFFLGFSSASGSFLRGNEVIDRPLSAANSLEVTALSGSASDEVYLDRRALLRLGRLPAAVFSHEAVNATWSDIVDGVIVFREQRVPRRSPPS